MHAGLNFRSKVTMHPSAVAATLANVSLRKHTNWIAACKVLLADKPSNVVLTDSKETGYIMLSNGELIAIPAPEPGFLPSRKRGVQLSTEAWDYVNECWQGLTQAESDALLTQPIFKRLDLGA